MSGRTVARWCNSARPRLEAAAAALGGWVVLATLAGLRRLVLREVGSASRAEQVDRDALHFAEKAYDSASIWLLLAYGAPARCQRFLACHGQPEGYPDGAAVEAPLEAIRKDVCRSHTDSQREVAKVAFHVWQHGMVTPAVGVHLPAFRFTSAHRNAIMAALLGLANRLGTAVAEEPVQRASRVHGGGASQ